MNNRITKEISSGVFMAMVAIMVCDILALIFQYPINGWTNVIVRLVVLTTVYVTHQKLKELLFEPEKEEEHEEVRKKITFIEAD